MQQTSSPNLLALTLLLTAVGLTSGCSDRPGVAVPETGMGSSWRWRAVAMDVSALTTPMLPIAGRGPMVDTRIEFYDSERDETKALGQLTVVVLFDTHEVGRQSLDLAGIGGHARAWDSTTETYSLRMPISIEPPPGRVLVVQSTFEGVDGARMTASREVRWPETAR